MAGSRAIKSRIKSTKNIQQITKAMQAVSAVKMRKSEAAAIKGRFYALYALDILAKIESNTGAGIKSLSPLFETNNEAEKNCLVVITSDKGLAGAFNSNVIRKSEELIKNSDLPVEIVAVGKKGRDFFNRKNLKIVKDFEGAGDLATLTEAKNISDFIINLYTEKKYKKIDVVFTNFISALKLEVLHRPLLPLNEATLKQVVENIIPKTGKFSDVNDAHVSKSGEYKFEPSPEEIVTTLVPKLVELEIFHSILEANASEHSARMVAMKNASENAKEMIGKLTIKYNKERQAQITKELIEITSGKNALEASE
jgi:F-type H+-transporting ATPase subunit gamma